MSKASEFAARAMVAVAKGAWDESVHPRDAQGRFGSTGSDKEIKAGTGAAKYSNFSGQDHLDAQAHYKQAAGRAKAAGKSTRAALRLAKEHGDAAKKLAGNAPAAAAKPPTSAPTPGKAPMGMESKPSAPDPFKKEPAENAPPGINPYAELSNEDEHSSSQEASPKSAPAPAAGAPDTHTDAPSTAHKAPLTQEEKTALRAYSGSAYHSINSVLRANNVSTLPPQAYEHALDQARAINDAINKNEAASNYTVYRGSTLPPGGFKVGQVVSSPMLLSTSTSSAKAHGFASGKPNAGVMEIKVSRGTRILDMNKGNHSGIPGEKEHLMGSHQKLYVTHVDNSGQPPRIKMSTTRPANLYKSATTQAPAPAEPLENAGAQDPDEDLADDGGKMDEDMEWTVVGEFDPDEPAPDVPEIAPAVPGAGTDQVTKGVLDRDQYMLTPKQRERYNQFRQQGIEDKVARQLAVAMVAKRAGEKLEAAPHVAPLRRTAAGLAARALGSVRKSYAANFVANAKDAMPRTYFDQLHAKARSQAGGKASGMARRALASADKAALLERRKALKAELAQLEVELQKTAPLPQEVAVDAPIKLAPKEAKKRKKLAAEIAADALRTVKSCPAGKEVVQVQVAGKVFKSAQPDWKRIVHSVVYAPGDVDAHGDYMHAEDIEKMAHDAMRSGLYVNHEHGPDAIEADIVESYIAPTDFNLTLPSGDPYHIPKGAHVMAMHVWGDEPWQKIQAGEYVGYSLEGTALRDVA